MENYNTIKITKEGFVWRIVDAETAKELFHESSLPIFALYSDDSEAEIQTIEELEEAIKYHQVGIEVGFIDSNLKEGFEGIAEGYKNAFLKKHNLQDAENYWVADRIGEILCCSDDFISYDDIRTDIDTEAGNHEYWNYSSYIQRCNDVGLNTLNYENWLKGAPRHSETVISRLENLREEFEEILKKENEDFVKRNEAQTRKIISRSAS